MSKSCMIGKVSVVIAAVAALGFAGAAEARAEHFVPSAIVAANNEVGIAITGNLTNYQEDVTPGPSDTESGWQPGFAVKGSYMGNVYGIHNVYAAVHYANSFGNIGYQGMVQTARGNFPYNGTDSATFNRVMARVGKGFRITCPHEMMITPYVAGGYQAWNRNLQGPFGYQENYSAGLVGAGALFQYAVTPRFLVSGDTEILAVIGGGVTPHILNGRLGSARFGTSAEEKMTLGVDYRITGPLHAYSDVSLTHFNYTGGSLAIPGAREPLSSTNQFGMSLGLAYQF